MTTFIPEIQKLYETDFGKMLKKAIKDRIEEIYCEEVKFMQQRIFSKIKEEVDRIALKVSEHYSIDTFDGRIVIKVKKF